MTFAEGIGWRPVRSHGVVSGRAQAFSQWQVGAATVDDPGCKVPGHQPRAAARQPHFDDSGRWCDRALGSVVGAVPTQTIHAIIARSGDQIPFRSVVMDERTEHD
jgi:hypothetical protein